MPIKPFGLSGGGALGCAVGRWNGSKNLLVGGGKNGGAGGGPNGGRGGWGPNDGGRGGDGGGGKLKLPTSSFGSGLFFNFSNLFLLEKSTPGGLGAFLISSLAISFFSQHLALLAVTWQLDFQHRMLKYPQKKVRVDSAFSKYSCLLDLNSV